ncbi:hypothetical protein Fmac_017250 [Flemingia macrophylla]|uniref:Uncharacterized protein n=1 Tax=Flemingia macrophylla TaxID=520843 RepID=A0ABD1M1K4_9FABA
MSRCNLSIDSSCYACVKIHILLPNQILWFVHIEMADMADSVVSFLLENLSRLLNDEIKLLSGVEEKVNSLSNELKFIDIFLKSSEGKRSDEIVKEVVSQIREVAYKAEDVVDTYVTNTAKHKRRNMLSKLFHFKERVMVLHEVDAEINEIKRRIVDIYANRERYGIRQGKFQSQEVDAAKSLREKRRRDEEEQDIVGLVDHSNEIIQQLKESDLRLKVVSIIGMGGLGKTTLARKIYNNNEVKKLFSCCAWGYVSNDYRPRELFLSLLKCLGSSTSDCKKLSKVELRKKVAEELTEKKYLIVLDDMWKTEVWDDVKGAFPDNKTGSRILITSRELEVARYTTTTFPYELPALSEDESWELFCKKVFRGEQCPFDLEPLGRPIVEKCNGLPLSIVVLAGLVNKKEKTQREWKRIKEVHLPEVKDILRLSYDNLPPKLKPCFLYFGIYPEDYEISVKEVIQLWIAEGFIKREDQKTTEELEDVGDRYMDDMVDRNLVQVAKRRRSDGGVKTCRIHDLLRDICVSECISDKFLDVCTESNIDSICSINSRRLSFHNQLPHDMKYVKPCTRSLFFFLELSVELLELDYDLKSSELVRVLLHSEIINFSIQPNNLKRMIHLRYLNIVECAHLPASISCLWNLQTLCVWCTGKISSEIWKLKWLRHLHLIVSTELPKATGERVMENLQTFKLHHEEERVILKLQNVMFPRLRKLTLYGEKYSDKVCYPLEELSSLPSLTNLQGLNITSVHAQLTNPNVFPSNLTKIELIIQSPLEGFMNTLGALPNLQTLKLSGRGWGRCEIYIDTGKFLQLQVFLVRNLTIDWGELGEDAMPKLRHLIIGGPWATEFPEQLLSLTTLRVVHLYNCENSFVSKVEQSALNKDCKLIITDRRE